MARGTAQRLLMLIAVAAVTLIVAPMLLAACGGDDDDGSEADGGGTSGASDNDSQGANDDGGPDGSDDAGDNDDDPDSPVSDAPDGAPEQEDPDFPDVYGELRDGASVETSTGDDGTGKDGTVRMTIVAIADGVEASSLIYEIPAGKKLWTVRIRYESTGEGRVPLAEFRLGASDGAEYEPFYGSGVEDEDILFGEFDPGDSKEGVLVFELPEDATVQWLFADPSIYVGRNIVFLG